MAWSSRQLWLFTGLMLAVVVLTVVGTVTVMLALLVGEVKTGRLLGNCPLIMSISAAIVCLHVIS